MFLAKTDLVLVIDIRLRLVALCSVDSNISRRPVRAVPTS